jgi:hypothetical protein
MVVPKTSIHKYSGFVFFQNDIRTAGKRPHIFSVSQSPKKQVFSDDFLRLCVLTPDMGHVLSSLFRRMIVGHLTASPMV